jgi:hypothetical protein
MVIGNATTHHPAHGIGNATNQILHKKQSPLHKEKGLL